MGRKLPLKRRLRWWWNRTYWQHPWVRKTRRWYLERYVYPKLCVGCGNPLDNGMMHGYACVMG